MLFCLILPFVSVSSYWINQPLQKKTSGFSKRDFAPDAVESLPSRVVRLNKRDTLVPVVQIGGDTTVVEVTTTTTAGSQVIVGITEETVASVGTTLQLVHVVSAPQIVPIPEVPTDGYTFTSPDRRTWGEYDIETDYTTFTPDTGRVVEYNLTLTETTILAPDGYPRTMQVFNNQYPGPLIEANWGDTVKVTINNQVQYNGTSIHWHGWIQTNTAHEDGVVGITQCPLPPGATQVYTLRAERYGTTWYHSHAGSQYGNGALGPMIVHGPASVDYDIDLGVLLVNDHYHIDSWELSFRFFTEGPPNQQATLFNGQGVWNDGSTAGSGEYYEITHEFKFQRGGRYRLRVVNSSQDAKYVLSLDEHVMIVHAVDYIPVEPFGVNYLFIGIGQRYDLVIIATGEETGQYWFRAALGVDATTCGDLSESAAQSQAIVRYSKADTSTLPISSKFEWTANCEDISAEYLIPIVKKEFPEPVDIQSLDMTLKRNATADLVFDVSGSSLYLNLNNPTLQLINDGFTTFPSSYNVYFVDGEPGQAVALHIQDNSGVPHPIHLHGHDMSILAQGSGTWDGSLNLDNPPRRDTAMVPASGHLVIGFLLDNPGTWLVHCHIAFHVAAGLGWQFVEQIDEIDTIGDVQQTYKLCSLWQDWTELNLVLQADSGV